MNMNARRNLLVLAMINAMACVVVSACGRQPNAVIQPALPSAESFVTAGDYDMHFNAVRTDQLTTEVARAYGIERSKNKVLLNVSVLNHANANNTATEANVTILARNLSNQVTDLPVRRVTEGGAIYYIGEVGISGTDTMVFEINAIPNGSSNTISAKLTREFFAN